MIHPATLLFGSGAAVYVGMAVIALWHLRWVRRLPSFEEIDGTGWATSAPQQIRCSIVVAARDEEARIKQTVRRLLAQHAEVEVIVVDDRSSDSTPEILKSLAGGDSRLRVIRVDMLPPDWLGKCHACHLGAKAAKSEWILFTDADCWLKPDLIARAVRLAEREKVDHVTLTSGLAASSMSSSLLRASHAAFLLSISSWFSGVNRDRPGACMGIGAFNLVRADAYRKCGGYEALRLTVLDDVKLGLLLARAGKRTRAYLGAQDVECHWGTGVFSIIKLMEKNYFAFFNFQLWLVLVVCGSMAFLIAMVILGLIWRTPAGIAMALSPLSLVAPAAILARRIGWSWWPALGVPFALPVFLLALLNSTFVTLKQGGIRWRETFYTLAALRKGGVR